MRRIVLALLVACGAPPAHHATSMQAIPPPDPGERQRLVVAENGVTTLVVGDSVALCTADNPSLLEVWGARDKLSLIGRRQGTTIMHVERPGKAVEDLVVEVAPPNPNAYALGMGTFLTVDAEGVKEVGESGPGIVDVRFQNDPFAGPMLVVQGKKPGTNVVLLVLTDGSSRSVEFTVVGGERQF